MVLERKAEDGGDFFVFVLNRATLSLVLHFFYLETVTTSISAYHCKTTD
jgi:hypothetical protein